MKPACPTNHHSRATCKRPLVQIFSPVLCFVPSTTMLCTGTHPRESDGYNSHLQVNCTCKDKYLLAYNPLDRLFAQQFKFFLCTTQKIVHELVQIRTCSIYLWSLPARPSDAPPVDTCQPFFLPAFCTSIYCGQAGAPTTRWATSRARHSSF